MKIEFCKRWLQLINGSNEDAVVDVYEDIIRRYSEPQRYYHTFEHVTACLNHFDSLKNRIDDARVVELAIWLHDVIYDPKSGTNEEDSASYASRVLTDLGVDAEVVDKVHHMILLTKHPSQPVRNDERCLIDIDLSILGSDRNVFEQYEVWIRKEYQHVSIEDYRLGRRQVLEQFLREDRIYTSGCLDSQFEQNARKNIEWAIERLK